MEATLNAAVGALDAAATAALEGVEGADEGLRELLRDAARRCAARKADVVLSQLQAVLAGEQACPDQASLAPMRSAVQRALAGVATRRDLQPEQPQAEDERPVALLPLPLPPPTSFFMGWLLKRSSRGVWQRRWVVLSAEAGALCYMTGPDEKAPARGVLALAGACVEERPAGGWGVGAACLLGCPALTHAHLLPPALQGSRRGRQSWRSAWWLPRRAQAHQHSPPSAV